MPDDSRRADSVLDDSVLDDSVLDDEATDFAVAAYREDGRWEAVALSPRAGRGLPELVAALRQLPAEDGAVALVSVGDDFCVIVRVQGRQVRLLLSDVTAAPEIAFAAQVVDALSDDAGTDLLDDDDPDLVRPIGQLDLLADLGLTRLELSTILEDLDLYPDEVLGLIAERLGFGEQFERAVEIATR